MVVLQHGNRMLLGRSASALSWLAEFPSSRPRLINNAITMEMVLGFIGSLTFRRWV